MQEKEDSLLLTSEITHLRNTETGSSAKFIGETKDTDGVTCQWVVKQSDNKIEDVHPKIISEVLGSVILKHLIPSNKVAQIKVVIDEQYSNKLFIASKVIRNFKNLEELYMDSPSIFTQYVKDQSNFNLLDVAAMNFSGTLDVAFANFFAGNTELTKTNSGVIITEQSIESANVDYDLTLQFCCVHDFPAFAFPSIRPLKKGDTLTVCDMVLLSHGGKLGCDRSLLIHKETCKVIESQIEKLNKTSGELISKLEHHIYELCTIFKKAYGEGFDLNSIKLPRIGNDLTLGNLAGKIAHIINERTDQLKELHLTIKLQLAIKENKSNEELNNLITESGYSSDKIITPLPESFDNIIKPTSITNYLREKKIEITSNNQNQPRAKNTEIYTSKPHLNNEDTIHKTT